MRLHAVHNRGTVTVSPGVFNGPILYTVPCGQDVVLRCTQVKRSQQQGKETELLDGVHRPGNGTLPRAPTCPGLVNVVFLLMLCVCSYHVHCECCVVNIVVFFYLDIVVHFIVNVVFLC